uniref:Trafficking protein particle complex subunit 6B n=1 Tax=Timema cristinae TaxID=61476 RepID=A0A7R9CYE3_TIMCR|nr:unnamed protein product [Timema cristinae]
MLANFATEYVAFTCGLIRGALSNLGINSMVTAEVQTMPACKFHIQVQRTPWPTASHAQFARLPIAHSKERKEQESHDVGYKISSNATLPPSPSIISNCPRPQYT